LPKRNINPIFIHVIFSKKSMLHQLQSTRKKLGKGLLLLCLGFSLQSTAGSIKGADEIYLNPNSNVPAYIHFSGNEQPRVEGFEQWLNLTFNLSVDYKLRFINSHKDEIGMEHFRYAQTYKGIPVNGSMLIVHSKNGMVESFNGDISSEILAASNPSINFSTALSKATAHIGAKSYKWESAEEEAHLKLEQSNPSATYYPQNELRYVKAGKGEFRLAYRLDIYANAPMSRNYVFVDALNGEILSVENRIHEANANGTAITAYSGSQPIITDFTGNTYRLRETGRGLGVETYDMRLAGTNYASAVDFTDADNTWNNVNTNKDQYAPDAHFGAEKTYDYFFLTHGRNSLNNAGMKLLSYIHYGTNYVNAFWDGTRMTYGDGNTTYSPLTTLDICGHEMTHGITEFSANLVYSYESGAMNEGFSDIFGTVVEYYANPATADWTVGEDIGVPFRSMSNPNLYNQPDTYLGTSWYTGTGDNGGVHYNSGVLNYWFYLVTNGGSGTNDINNAFNVAGIGMTKAAAIAYRTLTTYLTTNSQYANARTYSIIAAQDLYGVCSPEVTAVTNAWYAVGIGAASGNGFASISPAGPTTFCSGGNVTLNANTGAGITYQWNLNGSPIGSANAPTYVATQSGSYTVTTTSCSINTTSSPVVVTVNQAISQINQSGPITSCAGETVALTATTSPGYNIQWNLDGNPIPSATSSSYNATQNGNYSATISGVTSPAQVFNSTGATAIPDNNCTGASNNITVSGYGVNLVNPAGITISMNITHTYNGDLRIFLEAPNGDKLGLANGVGGAGDNFTNTVFSDAGATTIPATGAPYTGTYKPSSTLFTTCSITMNRGTFAVIGGGSINPNGVWKLRAFDQAGVDVGTINSWNITIPSYSSPSPNCGPVTSTPVQISFPTPTLWYADADADGFGNFNVSTSACLQPSGYVANFTDCNDNDNTVNTAQLYYVDWDLDGYGDVFAVNLCSSTAPVGYSTNNTDCDDNNANIHQSQQFYVDADGDGFGSTTVSIWCSLTAPVGFSNNNSDCNDNDNTVNTPQQYYVDADGDGFGSTTIAMLCSSTAPAGYSNNNTDCNDNDNSVNTPQQYYVDADGDGFGSATTAMLCSSTATAGYSNNNTDCNDGDASVNTPQQYYVDADGDGFGSTTTAMLCSSTATAGYSNNSNDCNDNNANANPSATEICGNNLDDNCDGNIDENCGPATQLRTVDCGRLTINLQSSIVADAVAGATQYEFQFKDASDASVVATRLQTSRTLAITNVSPALQWGTNYTVRVRPIIGTAVGTYGAPCTIGFLPDPNIFGIPSTQLVTSNCGKLNYLLASSITADVVIGATQYEFEFRNVSTNALVATKIQTNNFTTLSSVTPALQWGTQYNVRVRAYYGTIAGTYGNTCLIGLIPDPATSGVPNTQLSNASCNKTGLSLTGNITCVAVTGANQYEWEFTNPVGGALVALKTTSTSTCVISSVSPALQWGTQYNVRVRAFIAGTGGVFANTCLIGFIPDPATSGVPTTRLNSMTCGNLNLTPSSSIVALTVSGASQYEFEFSNPTTSAVVATKTTTSATCFLNSVSPALQWGTQYNVRVRAFIASTAGTFGNICLIGLVPDPAIFGVPATQIRTVDCGKLNFALNANTAANVVAGATQYEFEFSDPNTNAVVATKLQTSATLSLASVSPALQAGTTYNVRVRAYINAFQGAFGNICLIGFASGARFAEGEEGLNESIENVNLLEVYPNPYSSNATLLFSTLSNEAAMMNVFDMSGRLVEQKMIQTNTNVVFGENFERGVYIIQVNSTSGEQINTRLIKN
jgi:Zn-dependent metalloprotease/subtilisin-like proprotein convertase family protein